MGYLLNDHHMVEAFKKYPGLESIRAYLAENYDTSARYCPK